MRSPPTMRNLGKALLACPAMDRNREHHRRSGIQQSTKANYEIFGETPHRKAAPNYEKSGHGIPSCIRKYEGFGESALPCPFRGGGALKCERRGGMAAIPQGAQSRQL